MNKECKVNSILWKMVRKGGEQDGCTHPPWWMVVVMDNLRSFKHMKSRHLLPIAEVQMIFLDIKNGRNHHQKTNNQAWHVARHTKKEKHTHDGVKVKQRRKSFAHKGGDLLAANLRLRHSTALGKQIARFSGAKFKDGKRFRMQRISFNDWFRTTVVCGLIQSNLTINLVRLQPNNRRTHAQVSGVEQIVIFLIHWPA